MIFGITRYDVNIKRVAVAIELAVPVSSSRQVLLSFPSLLEEVWSSEERLVLALNPEIPGSRITLIVRWDCSCQFKSTTTLANAN